MLFGGDRNESINGKAAEIPYGDQSRVYSPNFPLQAPSAYAGKEFCPMRCSPICTDSLTTLKPYRTSSAS